MNIIHQNQAFATATLPPPHPVESPQSPVVDFRSIARDSASLRHNVYDRLLEALLDRRIVDALTGEVYEYLHPRTKALMVREGLTPLQVAQIESSGIDLLEFDTGYEVRRALPRNFYSILNREGRSGGLFDKRVAPIPSRLLNAIVCSHLLRNYFSQSELLSVPGFVLKRYEPEFDGEEAVYSARLDIEPYWARQGCIVPVTRGPLIQALQVFRYPKDSRPFILRSRGGEVALDA